MKIDISKAPTKSLDEKITSLDFQLAKLNQTRAEVKSAREKVIQDYFLDQAKKHYPLVKGDLYSAIPKNGGKVRQVIFKDYQGKWAHTLSFVCAVVVKGMIKEIVSLDADMYELEKVQ